MTGWRGRMFRCRTAPRWRAAADDLLVTMRARGARCGWVGAAVAEVATLATDDDGDGAEAAAELFGPGRISACRVCPSMSVNSGDFSGVARRRSLRTSALLTSAE